MTSALAMILAAAMAVPGRGPEKVSGETEQRLDLSGVWVGEWKDGGAHADTPLRVRLRKGVITAKGKNWEHPDKIKITKVIDEGNGNVRFTLGLESCVGIYRQEADRLSICFCIVPQDRPTSVRPRENQWLFILHRIKPHQ
jgi:hypothetical protein